MELFYAPPDHITGNRILLDEFESRHILQTLKKKEGDILSVTNGQGKLFTAKISHIDRKITLRYDRSEEFTKPEPEIVLAVGFIRPNRLEVILEKCTELGVNHYILFRSRYANYVTYNHERFHKILRQAIKQSLQYYLPGISIIDDFDRFIEMTEDHALKFVAENPSSPAFGLHLMNDYVVSGKTVLIAAGPEGGFSESEITILDRNNFKPVSLGNARLRTETAAIAAVSILQSHIQIKKEKNIGIR